MMFVSGACWTMGTFDVGLGGVRLARGGLPSLMRLAGLTLSHASPRWTQRVYHVAFYDARRAHAISDLVPCSLIARRRFGAAKERLNGTSPRALCMSMEDSK
jgi:hypothetical protein